MSTISSLPSSYQSVIYGSLFKKADANGDGSVSSDELASSMDQIKATLGDSTLGAGSLFTSLDADSNKAISATEFRKGLAAEVSGTDSVQATDATTARQEMISSVLSGIKADMVTTLLGGTSSTSASNSSYSSLSDLYALLDKQYGTNLTTYSASGSTEGGSLVGTLLNASA